MARLHVSAAGRRSAEITVRQLLRHTSGIRSYDEDASLVHVPQEPAKR